MLDWIKKHTPLLITILVTIGMIIYLYACQPQVRSIVDMSRMVNRQELQLELDQIITMAQLRLADLDKQEQLRTIILQNALILVQGQPLNPFGIITAIAAIFGAGQVVSKGGQVIKNAAAKRKLNSKT